METLALKLGNEVRRTMHNMIGLIELAAAEPQRGKQSEYLSRAREGADLLVRTVNDLTELARPATIVNAEPFAVRDALADVEDLMFTLADRRGLMFRWSVSPAVPESVASDKSLLQDILHRLVGNAIRFTPSGRVSVLATVSEQLENGPALVFDIADSGPGIPRDVLAALESPEGMESLSPLGLRIVKKRLTDLGGRMSISSNIRGTVVQVLIPVRPAGGGGWLRT